MDEMDSLRKQRPWWGTAVREINRWGTRSTDSTRGGRREKRKNPVENGSVEAKLEGKS